MPLSVFRPGLIVLVLVFLILTHVFYALWPHRRRAYLPIVVLTAAGVALGQLWDVAGLPSLRIGEANLLPAALFAAALQPLARFLPERIGRRSPRPQRPAD